MKSVLVLFLSYVSVFVYAQPSYLEPDNPAPRVGDQITLTAYFQKEDLTHLEDKEGRSTEEEERILANRIATASVKLNQQLSESGPFVVGPLDFTYNGVVYKTAPLALEVHEALPKNASDGIWIRTTEFNGATYLIVEQRIANKWKKEVSGNAITLSTEDVTYAEFDQDKFEAAGIEILSSRSSSHTQPVNKEAGQGSGSVSYKIAIYKYERKPDFKTPLKIDRKFFTNLPKNPVIQTVDIL